MRNWGLLLGLAAVLAGLVMAGAQAYVAEVALHANARFAGELFTIPLAASIKL